MRNYGYARVSTNGQTLASQQAQLRQAGCMRVFSEKISGAGSDRAELGKLLKLLEPGDVRGGPGFRDRMAAWLRWILVSITPPISPALGR